MNKDSWDKIKPSEDVKERVWDNIIAKSSKKTTSVWQKILPLVACLVLIVSIAYINEKLQRDSDFLARYMMGRESGQMTWIATLPLLNRNDIRISKVGRRNDGSSTANCWAYGDENSLITPEATIVEGTVVDAYNMKITIPNPENTYLGGKDVTYCGIVILRIDEVINGDITKNEVRLMLSGPLKSNNPLVGRVSIMSFSENIQKGQKAIFTLQDMNDAYDKIEVDTNNIFYYREIADYNATEPTTFIQDGDSLFFERTFYPTIENALNLDEVKEFMLWTLGKGEKPAPFNDGRASYGTLYDYENLPISYEQARLAAMAHEGIDSNNKDRLRSLSPCSWTYPNAKLSTDAIQANSQLATVGYPKDLPVYVVSFGHRNSSELTFVIVDAETGIVLMSFSGMSMYIR